MNKQAVLNKESISVVVTVDMINICLGRYIFLKSDSFAINADDAWFNELEKMAQGIIPEKRNIA
jgi:hypothetical protein